MGQGIFITFEGGEGTGKSTQAKRLAKTLEGAGHDVLLTREPGGSEGAEEIRTLLVTGAPGRWDPLTEALLIYAARRDHVEKVIRPALSAGKIVISDRFHDSTMAYQGIAGGLGEKPIKTLHELSLGTFLPDITFILSLGAEDGLTRAAKRDDDAGEDRFEKKGKTFHTTLEKAFEDIARANPERCTLIDAAGSEESVEKRISLALNEKNRTLLQGKKHD